MNRLFSLGILFPLVLMLLGDEASTRAQKTPTQDIDDYAARILKEFEVPGLSLAIVKDGGLVLAKGYGLRKIGELTPVDANTLFGIGSNTKAFTAAAIAILVDEKKIGWDDPVTNHLPGFQMYDPYVTHELTIRDLLTHRSGLGLGSGDLLFYPPPTTFTREEIMHRIRFMKPASSFRSKFAYDNLLYMVAGQIIPAVTAKSWDDFVKERIFTPLGMTSSNTSVTAFHPGDNVAIPHAPLEGGVQPVPYDTIDNVGPAGAINSSAADMAKWMAVQLDGGRIRNAPDSEQRLFSAGQGQEMWSAQTILPISDPPPPLAALRSNFSAYGLGWGLRDYRGHKIVSHTGGLAGFVSSVTLVPDLKLGIVVLTNQVAGGAFGALTYHILDSYVGAPATDWISAFHTAAQQAEERSAEAEKKQNEARAKDSKPSLALSKYVGRYSDVWYGEASINLENDKLVLRFSGSPRLVGDLEHWHYDTFVARWRDRILSADAFVTFALKPDGTIEQMKMVPVSALTDFSFDFQDLLFTPIPAVPEGAEGRK